MTEIFVVPIALVVSVVAGLWIYGRFSTAGNVSIAVAGLLRNGFTFLIGAFFIMSGMWPLIIAGGLIIIIAIFLGSAHASNLDDSTSLRKKIAG